jgi:DNA-binding XRE family transcriptional regulator
MSERTSTSVPTFNPKQFGHNIKEGRRRKGNMPQKELAELLHISRHMLIDIESGKRDAPISKAIEIAHYLEIPLTQLLGVEQGVTVNNLNNNQEVKVNIRNMNSEREMFERRIEDLRERAQAAERTCADLREDKMMLRAELVRLRELEKMR